MYFTLIILVHELGHFITGKLLGFKLKRIEIYPYGGCSKLEYDINTPLKKEMIVLLAGPIIQCVFVYIINFIKADVPYYFNFYHYFILIFNLLPIYPLDGGKLVNLMLSFILSYYNSLKYVIYFSYIVYLWLCVYFIISSFNFLFLIILLLLGIKLFQEIKKVDYYYEKFLLERYLNNYNFKKTKKINKLLKMKKDYYHYVIKNNQIIYENIILNNYFSSKNKKTY